MTKYYHQRLDKLCAKGSKNYIPIHLKEGDDPEELLRLQFGDKGPGPRDCIIWVRHVNETN